MRTPRVAILVVFFSASVFLFCRAIASSRRASPAVSHLSPEPSRLRSFFSFRAPFTLFPPNAAISLFDDNSTFFPARPAIFGPPLPKDGLSGQLWAGSGFTDDNLQDGQGEGELGCSDVVGWEGAPGRLSIKTSKQSPTGDTTGSTTSDHEKFKRSSVVGGPAIDHKATSKIHSSKLDVETVVDDGTDDYLHQGFRADKGAFVDTLTSSSSAHADIQSIQETAEITGKVVLLSRGGCGFLEKVKWAQRRGAIALIVGDNQKGGPLIQMSARGNVDNVTIPSVFTSRTTAHLLSSLMQPGSFLQDVLDESGHPVSDAQHSGKTKKRKSSKWSAKHARSIPETNTKRQLTKVTGSQGSVADGGAGSSPSHRSWFSRLFHWGPGSDSATDKSRPPSSGSLDWVIVDDWSDEKDKVIKTGLDKASKSSGDDSALASDSSRNREDGFQIGVQDWRDPDLASSSSKNSASSARLGGGSSADDEQQGGTSGATSKQSGKTGQNDASGPQGGSITPGSGRYDPEALTSSQSGHRNADSSSSSSGGLMSKIFGDDDGEDFPPYEVPSPYTEKPSSPPAEINQAGHHEGLWIIITPTSGASPFFDTLLVLVISPLITLTVVYALLILRAKIRRRRWRAPKSVVERLPVRTYHTVPRSPSQSSRVPSPSGASTPTTPLLQGPSRSSRPRSRTTTGIPEPADLLRVDSALQAARVPAHEKGATRASQWKKYMGRQRECAICLEEYVDGISRVMSLPCGHEFHAECITPWLTTRRRTCPICKGDVVRSLARGSSSNPRYEPYRDDDSDEDDGGEASGSGDPMFRSDSPARNTDIEQGRAAASAPERGRGGFDVSDGWFSALSNSLGARPTFLSRRTDNS
ncbi:hypothetical protein QBC45DRAFT_194033 [Copromyces sp. CBS 386.78]|uniref:RING-type E3 ubiquitin transferase n=1 Tax=Pseudoneurospora amorphoporcata TaxID=241081 RepID=A0AAN6P1V9_9PEZI|nr:hypothetical protein QBC45DRAFT_194033 [Copromyces sp. CBS 386.78]KAK3954989.1 hypothetical protein QBC32DRAFT_65267 [Pseudoneurospora amorphoporcata]